MISINSAGDRKANISFMNRLIMKCHSALWHCFLNHWAELKGYQWIDSSSSGQQLWCEEEEAISKRPKSLQWRPLGFTVQMLKSGMTTMWDVTAFGYLLLKSSVCPLPSGCDDCHDLDILVSLRNACAHVKPNTEQVVNEQYDRCVSTVLRFVELDNQHKVQYIHALISQREHKQWIQEEHLTIHELIGTGGHGQVHSRSLMISGRSINVVVKLQRFSTNKEKQQFTKELRAVTLASMQCDCSCRIFGVSCISDKMCLVMKLYEQSVLDLLLEGSLEMRLAMSLILQLFQALTELQEASILSRDIRPSNLLLDKFNNLVIADFGISHVMDSAATSYLATENPGGTCSYMAPECFQVAIGVGYKSDIWSAACVAVQMLSGPPPFAELQVFTS